MCVRYYGLWVWNLDVSYKRSVYGGGGGRGKGDEGDGGDSIKHIR